LIQQMSPVLIFNATSYRNPDEFVFLVKNHEINHKICFINAQHAIIVRVTIEPVLKYILK